MSVRLFSAVLSVCLWMGPTGGCGWGDDENPKNRPSTAPRGVKRKPGPEGQNAAPEAEAPSKAPAKRKPFDWDAHDRSQGRTPDNDGKPGTAAGRKGDGQEGEKEEKQRDFAAELRSALGSPVACLKPRSGDEVPPKITIRLTAVVVETGRVTRGSASSSQLAADENECITQRLKAARMRAPIEDAPRTISTSIELALKKKPEKATAPAP